MKLYQRTALVVAHEGFSGLSKRAGRKVRNIFMGDGQSGAILEAKEEYRRLLEDFPKERSRRETKMSAIITGITQ